MKKEGLQKEVMASKYCHPRLLGHCTDLDLKIGEVIAILNVIESLLDWAK